MAWYIDTSALVKLVTVEEHSGAIHEWVAMNRPTLVSSDLLRTEFLRAVAVAGTAFAIDIEEGLAAVDTLPATTAIFDEAGRLSPASLRSLDAVHLTTALGLAESCEGIVTYDNRLVDAARQHELAVVTPT